MPAAMQLQDLPASGSAAPSSRPPPAVTSPTPETRETRETRETGTTYVSVPLPTFHVLQTPPGAVGGNMGDLVERLDGAKTTEPTVVTTAAGDDYELD